MSDRHSRWAATRQLSPYVPAEETGLTTRSRELRQAYEAAEFMRAHGSSNNLAASESVRQLVQKTIEQVNARVSTSESIKKFAIVERDFEIEKDEVTPTGKLKREVVIAHNRDLIESLYL